MVDTTDYSDPCAAVAMLRSAYYRIVQGGGAQEVRIGDRLVRYAATDLALLRGEIDRLAAECAKKTGAAPRRFAIRAGSYRRPG